MFNLLIVDDFEIDRLNIKEMLQSIEGLNINIVGECDNGVNALEFLKENKVDIILSDIEMPFMNGLELAKNINIKYPNIKIIFCSLYDEFEYARKALFLNTYGYILKPLDKSEIEKALKNAINDITNETDFKKEYEELKKIIESSKPQLADNLIREIISGSILDYKDLWDKVQYLGLNIKKGFYCVNFVEIDDYENIIGNKTIEQKQIFTIKVYEKLKEISKDFGEFPVIRLDDSHFLYLISEEKKDDLCKILEMLSAKIIEEFNLSDISVTVSKSSICEKLKEIKNLYEQCIYTMRYKFTLGKGKVLEPEDIPNGVFSKDIDMNKMAKDIKFLLNSGEEEDIIKFVDNIIKQNNNEDLEKYVRNLCFSVITCVIFVLNENNENLNIIFKDEKIIWDKLSKFETIFEAKSWILEILTTVNKYLKNKASSKYKIIVEEIKKYIDLNYTKGITIDNIADFLHYSPNYLSYIFKQETNETITDYITNLKIEKAKEMLLDIRNKIYNISETLGFSNTAYFCSVFKKYTSLTPKEYRERYKS
ncbi:Two-component response regulator, YesN/AraC family, consists of REC and AraC-type DNA-binding domains [Clostridium sp. USBA 49]|uniref:response regulator transcription factor n=1 Tax=Clostridium sp. USBA 49 TaxID=1881060 RepID=UPI00099A4FF9|nr:response regulator [Clostridium sp. USBA 49]SKA82866.1 Two-component response regulator, YesN/AraC family, consists of REC and AraC-type DNA-binding domains [Clostridium sp. USBA 49]